MRNLPLVLLALVVAEIWVLVVLGGFIGGAATFGLVLVSALGGAALARREGRRAMQAWQQANVTGTPPGPELAASATMILAGVLLMFPGVITDVAALLLLLPPVRRALGGRVRVAFESRLRAGVVSAVRATQARGPADAARVQGEIIDVDPADVREKDPE